MKKIFIFMTLMLLIISCKTSPSADVQYGANDEKNVYKLGLNPAPGALYEYQITNESAMKMEVDDKKVDNVNKSNVIVDYILHKDSAGDFLMSMKYKSIHVYMKNGDTETDISTDGPDSTDAVQKLLGALKDVAIEAVISPGGEVKSAKGYDQLADKLLAGIGVSDIYDMQAAKATWNQALSENVIKKNMNQLFKIFPDSAVRVGDKWKLNSRQEGQIPFNSKALFTLRHMNEQEAVITSEGDISGDSTTLNVSGTTIASDLKGKLTGEYRVERKTGMISEGKMNSEIEGAIQVMGRSVPVTIKNTVEIKRNKKQ